MAPKETIMTLTEPQNNKNLIVHYLNTLQIVLCGAYLNKIRSVYFEFFARIMANEKTIYERVPKLELDNVPSKQKTQKCFGIRHVQAVLLFISLSIAYSMRAQLSISMVSMTSDIMPRHQYIKCNATAGKHNDTIKDLQGNNCSDSLNYKKSECVEETSNLSIWNVYRTYEWSKPTQEMILFSFFVGYAGMQIPMGLLAQKCGGKLPIMIALGTNAILSIITPWLPIWFGWKALCACRLLQGMSQAAFYPSIHTLLARWAPVSERGRLSSFIYTGSQFGTILAFLLAGFLAGSPMFRWPATFWTLGIASLICFSLFGRFGAASPQDHPDISDEELAFITQDGIVDSKIRNTPWLQIITSSAVWGLISAQVGSTLGYLLVLTEIPLYMNTILGVDIKRNGLYSSLPYIAMYFAALLFGGLSDYAANNKIMSVVNIRRIANSLGLVVSGLILLAFSYINNTALAVITLMLSLGMHSGIHVGFHINHIDLAPNFAGPIMAISNTFGTLSGLLVPVLVSYIVDDVGNQIKWQNVFFIVTLVQIVANIVFVIFVKGSVQKWNFHGHEIKKEEKNQIENVVIKGETILIKKFDGSTL